MIRARWMGAVAGVLVLAGAGWGQTVQERIITVKEGEKAQKCRVLKCWTEKDGSRVCQVQVIATGETMTIQESGPAQSAKSGSSLRSMTSRIFHWGKGGDTPTGVPAGTVTTTVVRQPQPAGSVIVSTTEPPRAGGPALFASATQPAAASSPYAMVGTVKAERWSAREGTLAQADAARKSELVAAPPVPVKAETRVEAKVETKVAPASADPLWNPEVYTKVDLGNTATEKPSKPRKPLVKGLELPLRREKEVFPKPNTQGLGSITAANRASVGIPEPTVVEPTVVMMDGQPVMVQPGAVLPGQPPRKLANAFTDVPPPPDTRALAKGYPVIGPNYVSLSATPPMEGAGVAAGMANAFTTGGSHRPIPAEMGVAYASTGQRGFLPPMMPAGMPGNVPVGYAAMPPAAPVSPVLLATLRESLYPSERETAADQLSQCDWRSQPGVVHALVAGAKSDPAPLVRVACLRSLGRMKVNTLPAVEAVKALKTDSDVRVRQEAEETLKVLAQ
jgi:hypothetical protein